MFSQVSVRGGGVCPIACWDPPHCILGDTGNKQAVCILLECILVLKCEMSTIKYNIIGKTGLFVKFVAFTRKSNKKKGFVSLNSLISTITALLMFISLTATKSSFGIFDQLPLDLCLIEAFS